MSKRLRRPQVEHLAALAEKVSSLPWTACPCGKCAQVHHSGKDYWLALQARDTGDDVVGEKPIVNALFDAEYAALACSSVPALCAFIHQLETDRDNSYGYRRYLEQRIAELESMIENKDKA